MDISCPSSGKFPPFLVVCYRWPTSEDYPAKSSPNEMSRLGKQEIQSCRVCACNNGELVEGTRNVDSLGVRYKIGIVQ